MDKSGITLNKVTFRIGDWIVYPQSHEVRKNGEAVRIKPKEMGVLLQLAERGNQVVTRDEILDAVWDDAYPNDEGLTQAISGLRKAFGDVPSKPEYIETIPKKGYRLVSDVKVLASEKEASEYNSKKVSSSAGVKQYLKEHIWFIILVGLVSILLGIVVYQNFFAEPDVTIRRVRIPIEQSE